MVLVCKFVFLLHQQINRIFLFCDMFSGFEFSAMQNFCQSLNAELYLFQVVFASEFPIKFKHSFLNRLLFLRTFLSLSCFLKIVFMLWGMLCLLNFSFLLL